jgi:hypothetical protein
MLGSVWDVVEIDSITRVRLRRTLNVDPTLSNHFVPGLLTPAAGLGFPRPASNIRSITGLLGLFSPWSVRPLWSVRPPIHCLSWPVPR